MSLIQNIQSYENQAKRISLSTITAQFSGVLVIDETGTIPGNVTYVVNDGAVIYDDLDLSTSDTIINTTKVVRKAWALPGIILTETATNSNIAPAISLPLLPFGFVNSDPGDILLITTIPKYWYPSVPNGDRLFNYELAFNIPFFEIKNNRQFFKVKQYNILEEGIIILQLSSLPIQTVNQSNITSNTTASINLL
jgi:hypothetical protein